MSIYMLRDQINLLQQFRARQVSSFDSSSTSPPSFVSPSLSSFLFDFSEAQLGRRLDEQIVFRVFIRASVCFCDPTAWARELCSRWRRRREMRLVDMTGRGLPYHLAGFCECFCSYTLPFKSMPLSRSPGRLKLFDDQEPKTSSRTILSLSPPSLSPLSSPQSVVPNSHQHPFFLSTRSRFEPSPFSFPTKQRFPSPNLHRALNQRLPTTKSRSRPPVPFTSRPDPYLPFLPWNHDTLSYSLAVQTKRKNSISPPFASLSSTTSVLRSLSLLISPPTRFSIIKNMPLLLLTAVMTFAGLGQLLFVSQDIVPSSSAVSLGEGSFVVHSLLADSFHPSATDSTSSRRSRTHIQIYYL